MLLPVGFALFPLLVSVMSTRTAEAGAAARTTPLGTGVWACKRILVREGEKGENIDMDRHTTPARHTSHNKPLKIFNPVGWMKVSGLYI